MLGGEEPKTLSRWVGIEEVVDRMNSKAERIQAEDEHKTEGSCPSGSLRHPTEH
jgi:hypothetical protein